MRVCARLMEEIQTLGGQQLVNGTHVNPSGRNGNEHQLWGSHQHGIITLLYQTDRRSLVTMCVCYSVPNLAWLVWMIMHGDLYVHRWRSVKQLCSLHSVYDKHGLFDAQDVVSGNGNAKEHQWASDLKKENKAKDYQNYRWLWLRLWNYKRLCLSIFSVFLKLCICEDWCTLYIFLPVYKQTKSHILRIFSPLTLISGSKSMNHSFFPFSTGNTKKTHIG